MCGSQKTEDGVKDRIRLDPGEQEYRVPRLEEAYRDDDLRGMGYEPECEGKGACF